MPDTMSAKRPNIEALEAMSGEWLEILGHFAEMSVYERKEYNRLRADLLYAVPALLAHIRRLEAENAELLHRLDALPRIADMSTPRDYAIAINRLSAKEYQQLMSGWVPPEGADANGDPPRDYTDFAPPQPGAYE